jgi:hypothetical protein
VRCVRSSRPRSCVADLASPSRCLAFSPINPVAEASPRRAQAALLIVALRLHCRWDMRTPLVALAAIGLLTVRAQAALAQPVAESAPVRGDRPISLGVSAAWPWMPAHDATAPLPAVRLSVNFSPRLSLDVSGGTIPYETAGRFTLVDLGARWFLSEGHASPYLMARAGEYLDKADEGPDAKYPYAAAGAGFEYACNCGLAAWAELAPAVIAYDRDGPRTWNRGLYVSVGVGYRFGEVPRR